MACGRPTDEHPDYRFRLPEEVFALPDRELTPGTWMSDEDAQVSEMMQVPGTGSFVRAVLPVHLTGGVTVTFGVWIEVDPNDLNRAQATWLKPAYAELTFEGRLANQLPLWDVLGSPVRVAVHDPDDLPYCDSSSDVVLSRVLTEAWPHDEVIAGMVGSRDESTFETACYVCTHVLDDSRPVLYVYRDDGDWNFLCGDVHPPAGAAAGRVVGLRHLLEQDATLRAVLDLAPDEEMEREVVGGDWTRRQI